MIENEVQTDKPKKLRGAARINANMRAEMHAQQAAGLAADKPLVPYSLVRQALTGRPPKYDDTLHPQAAFEKLSPPHCLPREVTAYAIGIAPSTFYVWFDKYPAFAEAVRAGEFIAEAYHAGRLASGTIKYSQGLIFYMKNRHAWKDKTEIEHSRKIDDLIKEQERDAQRVDWHDIEPAQASAHNLLDAVDAAHADGDDVDDDDDMPA